MLAVFCGPSLPPADRIAPDAVYLPPAARGDVDRASREFSDVLLIDGVFHYDLAPSPKEIFGALSRCRLSGAASMGALRAAECARYGMAAIGAIALWYLYERIDGDDEVAVLVDPRTQVALTVPLVNVRHVMRLAVRRGFLAPAQAEHVVERARSIYYMERTWDDVLDAVPGPAREAVATIARSTIADLKRLDARFAVRRALRPARLRT
ncbi:MAG: TfuA-like protein [Vulcanimicrobiaceae bacterium]